MEITTAKSDKEFIEKFYSKPFKFSYSSLNKLLYSPKLFYNWYVLREKEDKLDTYLVEGKVIHCLLLEKDMFEKNFSIVPGNIPTATNKRVVEAMYRTWKENGEPSKTLDDYSDKILEWLVQDNTHQSLKDDKDMSKTGAKTGDQKRLDKVLQPECREYLQYLQASGSKDVIDQDMYDRAEKVVDEIKSNKKICDLLRLQHNDFELSESVYNELMLEMDLEGEEFGLKGIIDNVVVDHTNNKIYINDIKTTGKSLSDFPETVEYYKYWMQAVIYVELVKHWMQVKDDEYEIIFHFIVIDKYNHMYPLEVSQESLSDWRGWFNEKVLPAAKYHYTKKDYTLPYMFAQDQVKL